VFDCAALTSLRCWLPADFTNIPGGKIGCTNPARAGSCNGGGLTSGAGSFQAGSGAPYFAGVWCHCSNLMYAALPCTSDGKWRLLYQSTYNDGSHPPYVWITVEANAAALTTWASTGLECSKSASCKADPTTTYYVAGNLAASSRSVEISCRAGEYVVLHEEYSVACLAFANFYPAA
jgi:hypothetical protein